MDQSRISLPHNKNNIRGRSHDLFPDAGVVQIINKANLAREQVRARTWGPAHITWGLCLYSTLPYISLLFLRINYNSFFKLSKNMLVDKQ